jgi:GMP synthase-like glutamine amidotransferase
MKILVFQHVASEHPGSFRIMAERAGHVMHIVAFDAGERIPPLEDYDAMLVMGGPMDVWETDKYPWLVEEMAAIREWALAGRAYLGICLGHQLLAQACGGEVGPMPRPPEVGIAHVRIEHPDPLFDGVPPLVTCFKWHGAEVKRLPPGAIRLASSEVCAIEAFRLGKAAYGLQFHMELTHDTAREWERMPEYVTAVERLRGPGGLRQLQAEVEANFVPLHDAATRIFTNFLRIAAAARAVTA